MKKVSAVLIMSLFGLISASLCAAENDEAGCKDHRLIPRMQGYFIAGCNDAQASFDMDTNNGNTAETVHIQGNSAALLYSPQPDLKSKPSERQVRSNFEDAITKRGGRQAGTTPGQKWPVYLIAEGGKKTWVVLMLDGGEYFTGSYAFRVIEE